MNVDLEMGPVRHANNNNDNNNNYSAAVGVVGGRGSFVPTIARIHEDKSGDRSSSSSGTAGSSSKLVSTPPFSERLLASLGYGPAVHAAMLRKNLANKDLSRTGFAGLDEHWLTLDGVSKRFHNSHVNIADPKKSQGLSDVQARELLSIHGMNELTPPPTTPWFVLLLRQFANVFQLFLLAAGVLSLVTYAADTSIMLNLYLALVLFAIVTITCVSAFFQERKTGKVMETFKKMLPSSCMVVRDGMEREVRAPELVVGDIVKVSLGDKIPADLRVLYSAGLKVECSSITGEAEPVSVNTDVCEGHVPGNEARCITFSGSLVLEGACVGVVIRTGDNTMIGQIAGQASATETRKTTLQIEIAIFVKFISIISVLSALIVFAIGIGRAKGHGVLNLIINGFLVIVVANVPQGLPATVTSLMTVVASRLAQKNVLVKRLDCIETLGSTTTIASDKTGTLTQNRMTVTGLWIEGEFIVGSFPEVFRYSFRRSSLENPNGARRPSLQLLRAIQAQKTAGPSAAAAAAGGRNSAEVGVVMPSRAAGGAPGGRRESFDRTYSVDYRFTEPIEPSSGIHFLYEIACICNKATFNGAEPEVEWLSQSSISERAAELQLLGNPSEIALLRWCELVMPSKATRSDRLCVFEIPFNSTTKTHTMIVGRKTQLDAAAVFPTLQQQAGAGAGVGAWQQQQQQLPMQCPYTVMMKGAPERIVALCSTYWSQGEERPMDEHFLASFNAAYERFGSLGQRVLGFCRRNFTAPLGTQFNPEMQNYPTKDLCFIGLTAITDPPRDNVPQAVQKCQTAGIRVAMVTGDHVLTACAIARQVNILPPDSAMEVPQIDNDTARMLGLSPCVARFHHLDWAFVEGTSVDGLTKNDWDSLLAKRSLVFARVTPNHKYMIVDECQKRDEIVAVTGDGVNDAPALKKAHIGVAMGKNGSEVAREAAAIVLMDDNFASIVEGVEQGRLIFDNLMKTIAYTLTHLMPEIVPVMLKLILGMPTGLSSLQILSIDLGTELAPAISLAYEDKESDIMNKPPRNAKKDRLASPALLIYSYLIAGILESIGALIAYLVVFGRHGLKPSDLLWADDYFALGVTDDYCISSGRCYTSDEQLAIVSEAAAAWHTTIVISQFFHIFSCKARRISMVEQGLVRNLVTVFGVGVEFALIIIFVYVPGVQYVMGTANIEGISWAIAISTGLIVVFANEGRKVLGRQLKSDSAILKYLVW